MNKVLFALVCCIAPAMAADAIEGSWKINKELSNVDKAQPDPPVRLLVEVSGKKVKLTREPDGNPASHEAGVGVVTVTQRKGSRGLQITGSKGGETVSQEVYQVSRDQKTMRVTMSGTASNGSRFSSVIWFDRTQ